VGKKKQSPDAVHTNRNINEQGGGPKKKKKSQKKETILQKKNEKQDYWVRQPQKTSIVKRGGDATSGDKSNQTAKWKKKTNRVGCWGHAKKKKIFLAGKKKHRARIGGQ